MAGKTDADVIMSLHDETIRLRRSITLLEADVAEKQRELENVIDKAVKLICGVSSDPYCHVSTDRKRDVEEFLKGVQKDDEQEIEEEN